MDEVFVQFLTFTAPVNEKDNEEYTLSLIVSTWLIIIPLLTILKCFFNDKFNLIKW